MSDGYKGFRIEKVESTQLGYRTGEGAKSRPGKGRKETVFVIHYPDSDAVKVFSTLRAATTYIVNY